MKVEDLLRTAREKGLRIVTAESCTGGMVAAALTDIPGASDVVECGFVTYSNDAKIHLLGVSSETLESFGAVSEETALEMADGALASAGADIAVSVTGIAGPGGSEHKPEGRVCFAIATKEATTAQTVEFGPLGRGRVRHASTQHALKLLAEAADKL
ncbi:CinA family protein [Roseovarius sp. CAU 1744]|uniref:CinA family protein n=1 Tax=Roseovarius sp. CAU 1744 TaxID=3140368 RepID=UPI00325AD628